MPKNVTHLIIGLGKGGAETMLYQILRHRTDGDVVHRVISLGMGDYYEEKIKALQIPLTVLPLKKKPICTFLEIRKAAKTADTLCCWMYHANFFGYLATLGVRNLKRVWCIRHSNLDPKHNSRLTLLINRFCSKVSGKIDSIVYNGQEARLAHEQIGYAQAKGIVLDNGCDLKEFSPQSGAREQIGKELGIAADKKIVLSVARYAPIKDIPTFVRAFGKIHRQMPNTVAVMCGQGINAENAQLMQLWQENGLQIQKDVFALGLRHDIGTLMSAGDVYILHSAGEAFPNTLIQAMACGALAVTTDVGDARRILANDSLVANTGDDKAIAKAALTLLQADKETQEKISATNRTTVATKFDIQVVVQEYEKVLVQR